MPYYKFLRAEHISMIESGRLRMGSLDSYRIQEALSGNRWIGDANDARVRYPVQDTVIKNESGDINFSIRGNTVITVAHGYIFSFSRGDFQPLYGEFTKDRVGLPGYSSAVSIRHPGRLKRAIAEGVCTSGMHAGRKIKEIGSLEVGPVIYGQISGEINPLHQLPKSSGFRKDAIFAPQQEWRVYLQCEELEDGLFIQMPDAEKLFKAVLIGEDSTLTAGHNVGSAWEELMTCARYAAWVWKSASRVDFGNDSFAHYDAEQKKLKAEMNTHWRPRVIAAYAITRTERRTKQMDDEILYPGGNYIGMMATLNRYLGIEGMGDFV
jgi:hypothetical protein